MKRIYSPKRSLPTPEVVTDWETAYRELVAYVMTGGTITERVLLDVANTHSTAAVDEQEAA